MSSDNLTTVINKSLFQEYEVHTVTLEGEPERTKHWFRATDVCEILYKKGNAYNNSQRHCKDWQLREISVGGGRPAYYICLSGVLRIALRSKTLLGIAFQDWLTEEMIPILFTQGVFILPTATPSQILTSCTDAIVNWSNQIDQLKAIATTPAPQDSFQDYQNWKVLETLRKAVDGEKARLEAEYETGLQDYAHAAIHRLAILIEVDIADCLYQIARTRACLDSDFLSNWEDTIARAESCGYAKSREFLEESANLRAEWHLLQGGYGKPEKYRTDDYLIDNKANTRSRKRKEMDKVNQDRVNRGQHPQVNKYDDDYDGENADKEGSVA